jgi:hypothetical protein
MKHMHWVIAAVTTMSGWGLGGIVQARGQQYADRVENYQPGTGFATDFGTGLGLTNASSALGAPARETPGAFGGPVDPFNPPYLPEQLLSLGAGGSVTLGFAQPMLNDPRHPFQLDFIIFGNAGFVITNGDYTGGGITDGSVFSQSTGATRVSVSVDGSQFLVLDPKLAPAVDSYFPTDGSGNFALPVDPNWGALDFGGRDLAGIRALYAGSGGGAGYDLSWARDDQGQPVELASARFVRIEVLNGHAEIDAVAAVPEPGILTLAFLGLVGMASARQVRFRREVRNQVLQTHEPAGSTEGDR